MNIHDGLIKEQTYEKINDLKLRRKTGAALSDTDDFIETRNTLLKETASVAKLPSIYRNPSALTTVLEVTDSGL